jgi:hypothetical protein
MRRLPFVLAIARSGCVASAPLTRAQEAARERWEKCRPPNPGVYLQEIRPDGTVVGVGDGGAVSLCQACMREAAAEQQRCVGGRR